MDEFKFQQKKKKKKEVTKVCMRTSVCIVICYVCTCMCVCLFLFLLLFSTTQNNIYRSQKVGDIDRADDFFFKNRMLGPTTWSYYHAAYLVPKTKRQLLSVSLSCAKHTIYIHAVGVHSSFLHLALKQV